MILYPDKYCQKSTDFVVGQTCFFKASFLAKPINKQGLFQKSQFPAL